MDAQTQTSRKTRWETLVEIAEHLASEGEPITYPVLSEITGWYTATLMSYVKTARRRGRWPWIMGAARLNPEAREAIAIGSRERARRPAESDADLRAEIEGRKRAELARCYAEMGAIDGRDEIDDPPNGIPPRSNRDHAAWSRMKFPGNIGSNYQRTAHKARSAHANAPKAGH